MGNVFNLSSATQRSHPEHMYQGRIQDYHFELWSILICRAIMEYIHHKLYYEKGIGNNKIRMWTILLCRNALDHIRDKPIYEKTIADSKFMLQAIKMFISASKYTHKPIYVEDIAYNQFQLWIILLWRATSGYVYSKPIYRKGRSLDQFINLPEDVQCIILSKLPLKEAVRTSVLSSKWRSLWTICPKLRFDGTVMFGKKMNGKQREQYARQFIDTVNVVLNQCHGKVVEELVIKFNFDSLLMDHLNNWVRFAASSHTKSLSFDLTPRGLEVFDDPQYIFPFKLFDSRCISHLQLHFVSIKLPTQFCGFPKLRKLDLRNVKVRAKELEYMLSNCSSLEWFSIAFCNMNGELKIQSPLPCLLFLNVYCCELTGMEFHAMKLKTFVYKGSTVPINLNEVSELKSANILFFGATFQDVIPALASVLTNVENLTFDTYVHRPKLCSLRALSLQFMPQVLFYGHLVMLFQDPFLMENTCKFSHLKRLQLLLSYKLDVDNLSLLPFLGSTPFIEKLEIHFNSQLGFFYVEGASIRRFEHRHNYLKDVCVIGFKASNGQIEFLVHIVENTPVLEVLTVDQSDKLVKNDPKLVKEKVGNYMDGTVYAVVRRYIEGTVSSKCCLRLLF